MMSATRVAVVSGRKSGLERDDFSWQTPTDSSVGLAGSELQVSDT
jgi:hypothetical protein